VLIKCGFLYTWPRPHACAMNLEEGETGN